MLKRILVALSGTPYTPVEVEYALDLARRHTAEITGVTVTDIRRLACVGSVPVGAISAAAELEEQRVLITQERVEQTIAAFQAQCRGTNIVHRVERETGNPLDELKALCRYHDLTIFGLRGLFEYGVVRNPGDAIIGLVRHGIRPILAVAARFQPIRRVLVAYSGSFESAKAMKHFVQLRPWPDVALRIACFERDATEGRKLLEDAAEYCRLHGWAVETDLVAGSARQTLLAYASECGSDLIVMGATSRSRILQHVLGDTVLTAIRESEVPLFLSQ